MLGEKHFEPRREENEGFPGSGLAVGNDEQSSAPRAGETRREPSALESAHAAYVEALQDEMNAIDERRFRYEIYQRVAKRELPGRDILLTGSLVDGGGQPVEGGQVENRKVRVIRVSDSMGFSERPQLMLTIALVGGERGGTVLRVIDEGVSWRLAEEDDA